jgi:hypothetical protein
VGSGRGGEDGGRRRPLAAKGRQNLLHHLGDRRSGDSGVRVAHTSKSGVEGGVSSAKYARVSKASGQGEQRRGCRVSGAR